MRITHGAHLVVSRKVFGMGMYTHHGIYVGKGLVVHFGGPVKPKSTATVSMVSFYEFLDGETVVKVRRYRRSTLSAEETCNIARGIFEDYKEGKGDVYNLLRNNCEHLATFCKTKVRESGQVQEVQNDLMRARIARHLRERQAGVFTAIGTVLVTEALLDPSFEDIWVDSGEVERILQKCRPKAEVIAGAAERFLLSAGVSKATIRGFIKGIEKEWITAFGLYLTDGSGRKVLEVEIGINRRAYSVRETLLPVIHTELSGWDEMTRALGTISAV